ncbi:MAG: GntR family transcriptional regulator [Limnobacter sp.]|uniref:GntR family transcriptional regulator n=1 Tax=Pseudomonadota TaxID=1224 RepID=UPI0032EB43D0
MASSSSRRAPDSNRATAAYEGLLDRILSKEISNGDVLSERHLAEQLNVSRTPLRAALGRLEQEGLVMRTPSGGLMLRVPMVEDILEILSVRRLLESEAASLAAGHIDVAELRIWRRNFLKWSKARSTNQEKFWEADEEFHASIAEASGNTMIARLIQNLRMRTRTFEARRMPVRHKENCLEHLAIIDALERHDKEASRYAMQEHLDNVRKSILATLPE